MTFDRALLKGAVCAAALALAGTGSAQPAGSTHGIPDFSGRFSHQTSIYQQPALGGRGPLGGMPGYESPDPRRSGLGNLWIGNYRDPILKPHNAQEVQRLGDLELASGGGANLTAYQLCWPLGVPFVLTQRENIQLLQQPDKITIIYQVDNLVRHINLNVPHSENVAPSWYGDSIGHYEGGTLVVDTIGQNGRTRADRYGSLTSPKLHVTERYHLADGGERLQVDFTVEDPGSFNVPWSGTQYYSRSAAAWGEEFCVENNRDARTGQDYEGMAVASRPDF